MPDVQPLGQASYKSAHSLRKIQAGLQGVLTYSTEIKKHDFPYPQPSVHAFGFEEKFK
jgi:hypothetical protein